MIEAPVIIKRVTREQSISSFRFTKDQLPKSKNSDLHQFREIAWNVYEQTPFPTQKDEAWRRTDLATFHPEIYTINGESSSTSVPENLLIPLAGGEQDGQVIVSSDRTDGFLSDDYRKQGVVFELLRNLEVSQPDLIAKLSGKVISPNEGKFAALASAMAMDGVLLYVPRNVSIKNPLHSVLWLSGSNHAFFSRIVIWLEEGASVTYVHEYASDMELKESFFHNGLVEIYAGPMSHLKFVELQSWGPEGKHIVHERAKVDTNAQVEWIFGAIGSQFTKSFTDYDLIGQGATIKVSGFYFADGTQQLDHDTQQNHLVPHTTSDLLFKGAVSGNSRSVWQGMIYVAPGAYKTDGYQANRNIVLSKNARADSIPGLEILADDVRCTHGATVGKVDEEQVFYLQTRGLPKRDAQKLVVEGFFEPVMERIPFDGVRERFRDAINRKMNKIDLLK